MATAELNVYLIIMLKTFLFGLLVIGFLDCRAQEKEIKNYSTISEQEFLNSLPEGKRNMLEKYQNEAKRKLSTILKTKKVPEANTEQYEVLSFLSREYQIFYVQDILLSEDGKNLGIFFSELCLDGEGNWKINPVLRRIVTVQDLENAKKNYRFKYTLIKGMGEFVEPTEDIDLKKYSRLMQEIFKKEQERKAAQTEALVKLREKINTATNPQ